ncbi:MAG: F-box protein [Chlamydiales bacterium]|nr:F-box protein [Chlamydiales bacterium]
MSVITLPDETLLRVCSHLPLGDLAKVQQVCVRFCRVAREPSLYVGVLDALRVRFPIITSIDGDLNTYQKALLSAKRICANQAKATDFKAETDDAFIDVMRILPHDEQILQALSKRLDAQVYELSHYRLTANPVGILCAFLDQIHTHVHWHFLPQINKDWMLLYALSRYVKSLPKRCLTQVIKKLSDDEVFALVDYLYPLRFSIKSWKSAGLDLSRRRSNGDSFAHLVVRHLDFIQTQCQFRRLDQVFGPAAFIDPAAAICKFKDYDVLKGVDRIIKKRPRTLSNDLERVEADANGLAKKFKTLNLTYASEVTKIACRCEKLTHATREIARLCSRQGICIQDPNANLRLVVDLDVTIFGRNGNLALGDLRFLQLQGLLHEVNQTGQAPVDLIAPYRTRYSKARWQTLMEIFDPPLQSSL